EDMRNAVPARDGHLESGPEGRQLTQGVIKAAGVHEIGDQEPGGEIAGPDQINAIEKDHHLSETGQEAVHRVKDTVGDACAHRGRIIRRIGLSETFAEVIPAVESKHYLEIVE